MIVLLMGVAGAGKTTIGQLLASSAGFEFADADSFHSPKNIAKMSRGIALTDEDRAPWLQALHDAIVDWLRDGRNVVLACSALKSSYRQQLIVSSEVRLVYLKGSFETIAARLRERSGHYVTELLLTSQFEALEEPSDALVVDVAQSPEDIVKQIRENLAIS